MVQVLGRFSIGFVVGSALPLVLIFIARAFFLTTVQTPESEPHYFVLYASLSRETTLAITFLLPVALGAVSTSFVKQKLRNWSIVTSTILAALFSAGIFGAFCTIMGDAMWIGMD